MNANPPDPASSTFPSGKQQPGGHAPVSTLPTSWNDTVHPWPKDSCVHQLFEEQVEKTPDALAVECEGHSLTYRELNDRANQLAHHLRQLGVRPGSLIGISLERSLEVIIGIYGILKAGGAYVPLDPSYPQDRLSFMVETARCTVLLTQEKVAPTFAALQNVRLVRLDTDWPEIASFSRENPTPSATPDDLIYVIFTSGSTGRPKGAAVYHKGFTNLLHWFVTDFQITAEDRALLISSLSFDLTQKNLYATLIRGGRLHLYPPVPYDVTLLHRLVHRHGVTLLNCTPSAFYPLVESGSAEVFAQLASLRIVFLGGENISIPRLRPWMTNPHCRADVANTYGPTECTDICGAYRMSRENMDRYGFVPLGRPIFNVQLAIADSDLRLCPPSTPGELCVAGAGVGAGYINDASLTAAKFIPNPFSEISGPTLYRTGDQARWLPDGVIEFLGRLDHQVKIRGFRIELNEIESALNTHPGVLEAIVVVKETSAGSDPRLVCFYTSKSSTPSTPAALKDHLKSRLPDYMIPSALHPVTAFPLSPNGKVDRRAITSLPEPQAPSIAEASAPKGNLEDTISRFWCEVLDRPSIGLDENFFDAGGNSIHLAQIHARLQAELKRPFPITDLFTHTTIRALANHFGSHSADIGAGAQIQDRARRQREAQASRKIFRRS